MIEKAEIDRKSEELGVHVSNIQRDYVFGWILAGLFEPANPLHDLLILKGGNAFRKAYFENARFSNDLDFSTEVELQEVALRGAIAKACEFAGPRSGVEFAIADTRVETRELVEEHERLYEARVYFRSFYGEEDVIIRINLDVKEFDKIILPVQTRRLIHAYSDSGLCTANVRCLKLEELLASKLKALLLRQHSPDLFDFVHAVFFQKVLDVHRLEVVRAFLKKTIYEPTPGIARSLLLDLPFQILRGLWDEYLVCPKTALIAFDEAEQGFRAVIPELFGLLTPQPAFAGAGGTLAPSHFAGGYRGTILEGGRLRRVLRVIYDGFERRVEPYALAFKRRKDGVAREYFYGWDLTGGRSGQTGIKSFIADNVQSVRITDESFEPRFPIELAKGGVGYFTGPRFPSSGGFRPVRMKPRRPATFETSYTVECHLCGKRFRRTKLDTKVNEHKDTYGNKCYGRVGTIV